MSLTRLKKSISTSSRQVRGIACRLRRVVQFLLKGQPVVQSGERVRTRLLLRARQFTAHLLHFDREAGKLLFQFGTALQRRCWWHASPGRSG